jgi:predicted PurR-regulated permease PerM
MVLLLVLVVWLHLGIPLLAALFSYLALSKLTMPRRGGKWIAVAVFLILISATAYGLVHFAAHTVKILPEIADRSIPSFIAWAKQHGIELPFTDYDSLKDLAIDTVKSEAQYLSSFARFARGATSNAVLLIAGCVVAVSLFLNPRFELSGAGSAVPKDNLYSRCFGEITARFSTLYQSFVTVMGAQILISAINTVLTAIFVLAVGLPYSIVVIGVTFICGLLPVVGNVMSNTAVVMIGFTVSPQMALGALAFLVVVHKLEYFLNSKIVGWRIRNPLWLTLLGLILGEKLMGVPGMVIAPVILNYIKLEASRASLTPETEELVSSEV